MRTLRLRHTVTTDRQINLTLPPDFPVGVVDIVVRSMEVAVELPDDAPVGPARIIVMFPQEDGSRALPTPRFNNIAEFTAWLETQPPTGRTAEEVDRQIREERESWGG